MENEKQNSENHWYRRSFTLLTILLLPFSWLFRLIVFIRYYFYHFNFKKKIQFDVPVIVVGNLTVGGTGKTPFVIWLLETLQKKGYRPGIVSRGVGGKKCREPCWVDETANPAEVGDEALLLTKRTHCPMVACIDRVAAVQELLNKTNCNIVISDDGLQHYRMGRNIEIVIVDGRREFGNKQMLPAGPLREPLSRLRSVDLIVVNGASQLPYEKMVLQGDVLFSVLTPHEKKSLTSLHGQTVHAIAGIGNPERFFSSLRKYNIQVIEHIFPDHYLYKRDDIYFTDNLPIVMTEKDAVKCVTLGDRRHWYLPVNAHLNVDVEKKIFSLLEEACKH